MPTLSPRQLLDAVPVRNQAVRTGRRGGELLLYVSLKPRWFMRPPISLLMPFRKERGTALDTMGQEVWQACDGGSTVEQIVERFAQAHHLRFHEARMSVMQFLRDLTQRGLLVIVGDKREAREEIRKAKAEKRRKQNQ
ncbi:MAG: PqqD family protein [Phycisphaeraceae bacterium]